MRPGRARPFVWPLTLIGVAAGLILTGWALARLDGFRLYGLFIGMGQMVGVIGGVWLMVVLIRIAARSAGR